MANLSYEELAVKAFANELVPEDINAAVLALVSKNNGIDRSVANLKRDTEKNKRDMRDVQEEYPLLPPEADDLAKAVQRKGCEMMGGKRSPAYQDTDIRRRVYRDIYTEIKREFGLIDSRGRQQSYKKLKRKYLNGALEVVADYVLPSALESEIEMLNEDEFVFKMEDR